MGEGGGSGGSISFAFWCKFAFQKKKVERSRKSKHSISGRADHLLLSDLTKICSLTFISGSPFTTNFEDEVLSSSVLLVWRSVGVGGGDLGSCSS